MKLKLNKLHYIGLALSAAGIIVLIVGLVIFFKSLNIRDLSKLKFDDIKSGTYVKGKISTVVKGSYPVDENNYKSEPYELYVTDSEEINEGAYKSYFLMELENDPGKFVCVVIDQYYDTDLYNQIFSENREVENISYDVEGIITSSKADKKLIKDKVENWKDNYTDLYYNSKYILDLKPDSVSDCCIKLRPMGTRKFWWLYSIPFLFAGISVFILGGRPYERIK
jgi:hypothetical protein